MCCKDGSMAEVSAPIGEYDTSQSYHLESVSVSSRTFVSIKDRLRVWLPLKVGKDKL